MELKFTKMQGCGNDYIYIDCFEQSVENPEKLAVKLSDRHFGIGGDGVILICPSDKADCKMRMFNLDGSEGNMCGNGIRCVGRYMYDRRGLRKDTILVETKSGIKELTIENGNAEFITVNMGIPSFDSESIPVKCDKKEMIDEVIVVNNTIYKGTSVSVGNPHFVIFCDDTDDLDVCRNAKAVSESGIFPNGVNVEFVCMTSENEMKMRVCERGSGETLACGTGACACVAAAVKLKRIDKNENVKVKLLGGELSIRYTDSGIMMTGDAQFVFDGKVDI